MNTNIVLFILLLIGLGIASFFTVSKIKKNAQYSIKNKYLIGFGLFAIIIVFSLSYFEPKILHNTGVIVLLILLSVEVLYNILFPNNNQKHTDRHKEKM